MIARAISALARMMSWAARRVSAQSSLKIASVAQKRAATRIPIQPKSAPKMAPIHNMKAVCADRVPVT
jgi:hypothetical protein